mmetsp:Transcript_13615/g.26134  ORF Transcript_13615/g.26134 Transcript_13615/m.26134 type:complete len:373 (+) Transcript_13615:122-1240(+)|eukprot:scaffold12744_cov183-Amphora_coffeaeformis.AAC.2
MLCHPPSLLIAAALLVPSIRAQNLCFETRNELKNAVVAYLANNASDTIIATTYGWPIGTWCVENVQDFSGIFEGASGFNEPLNEWDVSNAESMPRMFFAAVDFNQPLNLWNTSQVENMEDLFAFCTVYERDLSSWDVSKVTNMKGLFRFAEAFNGDISSWDTSNVITMRDMFWKAVLFNADVSQWSTSNVTDMHRVFAQTETFDQDLSHWDTSKVSDMSFAFWNATAFGGTGLPNWDVSSVIDATEMFLNATNFNSNLCAWDNIVPQSLATTDMFQGTSCPDTSSPNLSSGLSSRPWCQICGAGEAPAPTPNPLSGPGGGNFMPTTASPTVTFRPTAQPSSVDQIDLRSHASRIWNIFGTAAMLFISCFLAL